MANPGIPTSLSHGKAIPEILAEINGILVNGERVARLNRIDMAAGPVSDEVIRTVWHHFADAESRLTDIATSPDLRDDYAQYRGLYYEFNCDTNINATNDTITGLPNGHKFKTDHRLKFKLIDGTLPGGITETAHFWGRTIGTTTMTISATEGGASDVDLTAGSGTAAVYVNIKQEYQSILVAIDAILDEIEANLAIRGTTYNRANLREDYSTRDSTATATLRTKLSDFEALIDTVAA